MGRLALEQMADELLAAAEKPDALNAGPVAPGRVGHPDGELTEDESKGLYW